MIQPDRGPPIRPATGMAAMKVHTMRARRSDGYQ